MKKLLICLSAGLWLSTMTPLHAQYSIHSTHRVAQPLVEELSQSKLYIGLSALALQAPQGLVSSEDARYIERLSEYIRRGYSASYIIDDFCAHEGQSIDLQRARLLLGIAYFEAGEEPDALAQLNSLEDDGLYRYEQDKANLLRAYLYTSSRHIKPQLDKAIALIQRTKQGKSVWAEQARLYEANILWAKGDVRKARQSLEQGVWSESLLPEVEYTGALIAYQEATPAEALKQTARLVEKYRSLGDRPRLQAMQATALYRLKRYKEAEQMLEPLAQTASLLPEEYYSLGMALYMQRRFPQALPYLQQATTGRGNVASYAQFTLGNIYRFQGDPLAAQLAFEQALKLPHDNEALEEETRYQLIELGYSGGQDAFGSQIKRVEQFLSDYPQGAYEGQVLKMLEGYINRSTDYESAIKLIDRLEKSGRKLSALKQSSLVRWAERVGVEDNSYLPLLAEAITLGSVSDSYAPALLLRAERTLGLGRYPQAERDARQALTDKALASSAKYILAYALYNQKKYAEAAKIFETLEGSTLEAKLQSDALVRLGNCLSEMKRPEEAARAYRKADEQLSAGNEEALYRLAMLFSRIGRHAEQIETTKTIEHKFPSSAYRAELLYRRGRAELLMSKPQEAIQTFSEVQRLFPASGYAPTALLERALLESNHERTDDALRTYKSIINLYPESHEAENALSDLRAIYSERNALDEYATYVRSLTHKIGKQPEDEAHLSFISIESKVRRGEAGTTDLLERYLKDFPSGADRLKAERLLVKQYVSEGRSLDALRHLSAAKRVAKGEEVIALALEEGDLLVTLGRRQEAYKAYQDAYKLAQGTKYYSQMAGLKLLRLAEAKDLSDNITIVQALLSRQELSPEVRAELTLLKGKLLQQAGNAKGALEAYALISREVNSPYGAEALVMETDLLYRQGRTSEAEKQLKSFVASGTSQTYWLARAFLLLADVYEKQGDLYMVKQYVESLQDNYTGDETDIQEMISTRLNRYNK